MIFTPLGPDFPESLINDLLEGDMVFLCGAGVSASQPQKLENLVRQVYATVGEKRTSAEDHAFSDGRAVPLHSLLAKRLSVLDEN